MENGIPDVAASISSLHNGMATKIDTVHNVVTQGTAELHGAIARSQQETRQLSSRISVMETGFNYIFMAPAMPTLVSSRPRFPDQAPSHLHTAVAGPLPSTTTVLPIPKYKLLRVWYTGSVAFPSIVSLDERYGATWLSGDCQYYSEVDRLAAARNILKGDSMLDAERREKSWTLNMLKA
ncbi:hypothetical protein V1515DRAFT_589023 [Lipomyces mesembrius]